MILKEETKEQALEHAKRDSPRESVGLVYILKGREKYYECSNLTETPDEHFVLPHIMSNTVVFPAPLGPIKHLSSPSFIDKSNSFTALNPSKSTTIDFKFNI